MRNTNNQFKRRQVEKCKTKATHRVVFALCLKDHI